MEQPGQSVVELALIVSLLAVLGLGLLDFGRAFYIHIALTNAAREGARYATRIAPDCSSAAISSIKAATQAEQSNVTIDPAWITTNCADPDCLLTGEVAAQIDRRRVCITYPFTPVTPLVAQWGNGSTITVRTWATLPT